MYLPPQTTMRVLSGEHDKFEPQPSNQPGLSLDERRFAASVGIGKYKFESLKGTADKGDLSLIGRKCNRAHRIISDSLKLATCCRHPEDRSVRAVLLRCVEVDM